MKERRGDIVGQGVYGLSESKGDGMGCGEIVGNWGCYVRCV